MAAMILFVFVLALNFGVLVYFLRPTPTEAAVQQQLAGIDAGRAAGNDTTTIVREQGFSANPVFNDLIKDLPGSRGLLRLIRQAGQHWQVGSVFLFSILAILLGWWLASLILSNLVLEAMFAITLALLPYIYLYIVRSIRFRRFANLLPEAVGLVGGGLRGSQVVTPGLEMGGHEGAHAVGPMVPAFHGQQGLALTFPGAMLKLLDRA